MQATRRMALIKLGSLGLLTGKGGDASHGDYQYFKIDSSTGALSFITMPDYENDLSVSGLNQYELRVVLERP